MDYFYSTFSTSRVSKTKQSLNNQYLVSNKHFVVIFKGLGELCSYIIGISNNIHNLSTKKNRLLLELLTKQILHYNHHQSDPCQSNGSLSNINATLLFVQFYADKLNVKGTELFTNSQQFFVY